MKRIGMYVGKKWYHGLIELVITSFEQSDEWKKKTLWDGPLFHSACPR